MLPLMPLHEVSLLSNHCTLNQDLRLSKLPLIASYGSVFRVHSASLVNSTTFNALLTGSDLADFPLINENARTSTTTDIRRWPLHCILKHPIISFQGFIEEERNAREHEQPAKNMAATHLAVNTGRLLQACEEKLRLTSPPRDLRTLRGRHTSLQTFSMIKFAVDEVHYSDNKVEETWGK